MFLAFWGSELYGEWLMLTALPTYLMLCSDIGITGTLHNELARMRHNGTERKDIIALYSVGFKFVLFFALSVLTIVSAIAFFLPLTSINKLELLNQQEAFGIVEFGCIQLLLTQLSFFFRSAYRCENKNARAMLLDTLCELGKVVVGVLIVALGFSPLSYSFAITVVCLMKVIAFALDSYIVAPWLRIDWFAKSYNQLKGLILPGLGLFTMTLVNALQNQGALLVLGWAASPAVVAMFQVCRTFINGIAQLYGIIWNSIYPELASAFSSGLHNQVKILMQCVFRLMNFGFFIGFFLVIFFGDAIFKLWLHRDGFFVVPLVLPMFFSLIPYNYQTGLSFIAISQNKVHNMVLYTLLVRFLALCMLYLTVVTWGLTSVGYVFLVSEMAMTFVVARCVEKLRITSISEIINKSFVFWTPWRDLFTIHRLKEVLN